MAGLLTGLEEFGLGNLADMNLYEEAKEEEQKVVKKETVIKEEDYLFDKGYTCPICEKNFKAKTVRVGKAKLIGTDLDLRPKYEGIDLLKYDIILCNSCGYATLSRYFKFCTSNQVKLIKDNISANFKPKVDDKLTYSYEDAMERYKLTLANAIVKKAKPSEKAYICLKTAWLLRGQGEHLDEKAPEYAAKKKQMLSEEETYLKNALEGFLSARQSEDFPMCGMDAPTVDYLIAVLAMRFEQFDISARLIAGIISSPATNSRMKDKARDLKDMLMAKIKEQKEKV